MSQLFLLAALHASWLPAHESGKFVKLRWWQLSAGLQVAVPGLAQLVRLFGRHPAPLSEQVPLAQMKLPEPSEVG